MPLFEVEISKTEKRRYLIESDDAFTAQKAILDHDYNPLSALECGCEMEGWRCTGVRPGKPTEVWQRLKAVERRK